MGLYVERAHGGKIDVDLKDALLAIQDRMERHTPRSLTGGVKPVLHIYTDACFDEDVAGLGGVLVDEDGKVVSFFRYKLTPEEIGLVNISNNETIIGELEALAMLLGLEVFGMKAPDGEIVLFGDNEGAIRSFMKMRSENRFVTAALRYFSLQEEAVFPLVWFERVASASNVADGPSRQEKLEGVEEIDVSLKSLLEKIVALLEPSCRMIP